MGHYKNGKFAKSLSFIAPKRWEQYLLGKGSSHALERSECLLVEKWRQLLRLSWPESCKDLGNCKNEDADFITGEMYAECCSYKFPLT